MRPRSFAAPTPLGAPTLVLALLSPGAAHAVAPTPDWAAEPDQANAWHGQSVSSGDVDGDGFHDVLVGAPDWDGALTNEGGAFLYRGSAAGVAVAPDWSVAAGLAYADFGRSVGSGGDVDGDGYDDVLVGAPEWDGALTNEGSVLLFRGSAAGPSTAADWAAQSGSAAAYLGWSVASAGDIDGDGYDDVLGGAVYWTNGSTNEGAAFVYLGSAAGPGSSPDWSAEANQTSAFLGISVAPGGDVDGDGYDDVLAGASYWDGGLSNEGAVFLYLGSPLGLGRSADWSAEANQANARHGDSVASAGDVNGDGYDDVLAGSPAYSGGSTSEGRVWLYLGSAAGPGASAHWTAESDQAYASLGQVASAGDVDGDGYDDVLAGAPSWDGGETDEGAVFLWLGASAGPGTSPDWSAESDQASASFGEAVASAGDVNDDGYAEVIAGAFFWDGGESNEGGAFLFHPMGVALVDGDGDGYLTDTDCDDADGGVYPGALEICDGVDQDCDDVVDEGAVDAATWFADADGDSFGEAASTTVACAAPPGAVADATDCDDADAAVSPAAPEAANGIDDDCDGDVDELTLVARPLVGGRVADFTVSGAPPSTWVFVLRSPNLAGPGACPGLLAPTCLDIASPVKFAGSDLADATGLAEVATMVSGVGSSIDVELQAVTASGALSNVLLVRVHAAASDDDGDGLTAGDEVDLWGTDPGLADTDGGGLADGDEVLAGTDPTDPTDD